MKNFKQANEILRLYWAVNLDRKHHTLEYMVQLMEYLGNPQEKLKIIHVAGTSGKTSTAYYCAALLKAAGKKVGLTVSPHVDEVNERVQINLTPLPEAEFCEQLNVFLRLIKQGGMNPTYFELVIAFAYWEFVRQGAEYAVIEVGLGGTLDGTNIVRRPDKVCVITDIGLDHMDILGGTLEEIAGQKAGIIQLNNSVLCYRQSPAVMAQIEKRANQKQADLHILGPDAAETGLEFLPLFQQRNLGLARAAVNRRLEQDGEGSLTDEMVAGAAKTYIPARMETLKVGGKTLIVDGAHNYQKLHALLASVRDKLPGQSMAAVVSFADGRSYRLNDAIEELAKSLDHVIITAFSGPQDGPHHSVDSVELVKIFKQHGAKSVEAIAKPEAAMEALFKRPEPVFMVAGSFYLLNHIRPWLGLEHM